MKTLMTAAAIAGTLAGTTASALADPAYLEIAVYTVGDPAGFVETRSEVSKRLPTEADGLLWWHRLVGQDGMMADVLAWRDPEAAHSAAALVEQGAAYAALRNGISEMIYFGHFMADQGAPNLGQELATAPLVEIALYTAQDPGVHQKIQRKLHNEIKQRTGMLGGSALVSDGSDQTVLGDLLAWQSSEVWQETGEAMMAKTEYAPFFQGVGQSFVFALFEREGAE